MKKICLVISLVLTASILFSCNAPEECEYQSAMNTLKGSETVDVCVYEDGETIYEVEVTEEFLSLFKGEFEKCSGGASDKIVSVEIADSYEMSFFDNGNAMIFYGVTGIFESDRQYYKYKLDKDADAIVKYVLTNGTQNTDETESESEEIK